MNNLYLIGAIFLLLLLVVMFLRDNPQLLKKIKKSKELNFDNESKVDVSNNEVINNESEEHPIDKFISNDIQNRKIFNLDLSEDLNKEEKELRRILFGLISKAKTEHPETKQMVIPFESIIFLTKGLNPLVSEDGKITVVCRKTEVEKNSEHLDIENNNSSKKELLGTETVNNYENAIILGEEEIKKYMEEAVKIHNETKETPSSEEELKKQIEALQNQLKEQEKPSKIEVEKEKTVEIKEEVKESLKTVEEKEKNLKENNKKQTPSKEKKETEVEPKEEPFKEKRKEIENLIDSFDLVNNKSIREEKDNIFKSKKENSYDNFIGKLKNIKKENDLSKKSMEMEFERVSLILKSNDTVYDKKDSLLKLDILEQNKLMKEIIEYLMKIKDIEETEEDSIDSLMDDFDIDNIDMDSLFENELEVK